MRPKWWGTASRARPPRLPLHRLPELYPACLRQLRRAVRGVAQVVCSALAGATEADFGGRADAADAERAKAADVRTGHPGKLGERE